MSRILKIKICGVTRSADARLAVELGADLLGLNFHPPSPRYVDPAQAREIAAAVGGRVPLVGVFVNRPVAGIEELVERVGLDLVQLHGDERPDQVAHFGNRAIKVFRRQTPPEAEELARYPQVWGFLFDVPHETLYGGTGQSWAYEAVVGCPDLPQRAGGRRVLIAGGVSPDNVAGIRAAVEAAGLGDRLPVGVDVCSGVEAAPGVKDRERMERLFSEVRDGQSPSTS